KVIIVCSTTGNGDPPSNAEKFWRFIKKRAHPSTLLKHVQYTVLGLGDTNYDKFCHMGKSIYRRLKDLGAESFYDLGCADEAMGLEDAVEPWIEGFWKTFDIPTSGQVLEPVKTTEVLDQAMQKVAITPLSTELATLPFLASFESIIQETKEAEAGRLPRLHEPSFNVSLLAPKHEITKTVVEVATDAMYNATTPFLSSLTSARYLTTSLSKDRTVLALELDISSSGIEYVPGDVVGINCPNDEAIVDYLLQRLQVNEFALHRVEIEAKKKVTGMPFPLESTLRDIFLYHLDLVALPKKATLRALASYCTNAIEKTRLNWLSSKDGGNDFRAFIDAQYLSIVEILALFPSCQPPLNHVLSLFPRLSPRYYSIASSPLTSPSSVSIAFTVVEYTYGNIPRKGLCSTWLNALAKPLLEKSGKPTAKVPIFLKPATDFILPSDASLPLVLIGPGTGVAPFMGFLEHRAAQTTGGPIHLFFGCRSRTQDYLFQFELEKYHAKGTLTSLFTAFSRDQAEKHYVTHELIKNGALVYASLVNGHVYVCGDGMLMAKDVQEALVTIFVDHGDITREEAENHLKQLGRDGRYVRDIWC
ncbi:NADPH-cytochrome P450 reductase, partial [Thraustotheca clavata]